jgi:hypothetical protein
MIGECGVDLSGSSKRKVRDLCAQWGFDKMLQKFLSNWATRISAQWSYIRRHGEVRMPLLESSVHLPQTHASPLHKNATCGCSTVCPITGMYFFCPLHYSISVAQVLSCNTYKNSSSLSSSHEFGFFSGAVFVYTPSLLLCILYFLFLARNLSLCGWPILSIIMQMGAPSNFVCCVKSYNDNVSCLLWPSGYFFVSIFSFFGLGETESTWYVCHHLAYCTSPGWQMTMMWRSLWNEN